jgi:hypothetical protein
MQKIRPGCKMPHGVTPNGGGLVDSPITVYLPGGESLIEIARDGLVTMTGPVEGTFQGNFHNDLEKRLARS